MEKKPSRSLSKLLSFLPKQATVSYNNPPFSPGREKRTTDHYHKHASKYFSGPIISIVPVEARGNSKTGSFHQPEPTSPKISCMGQIKHKKKICKAAKAKSKEAGTTQKPKKQPKPPKRSSSSITSIFHGKKSNTAPSDPPKPPKVPGGVPALGQMKRFSSSRDTFSAQFDWKNFDAKVVPNDQRQYSSDDDDYEDYRDDSFVDEDEVIIPHSAPIFLSRGVPAPAVEPKKEINLWKRRTMAPPRPLQVYGKP